MKVMFRPPASSSNGRFRGVSGVWMRPAHGHAAHPEVERDASDRLSGGVPLANGMPAGNPPIACFQFSCFHRLIGGGASAGVTYGA